MATLETTEASKVIADVSNCKISEQQQYLIDRHKNSWATAESGDKLLRFIYAEGGAEEMEGSKVRGTSLMCRRCYRTQENWRQCLADGIACRSMVIAPTGPPPPPPRVCRDKTHLLTWQKYACCDKTFVTTKLCLLRQNIFVATYICRDKQSSVATRILLSWQNMSFVATKVSLSRQKFCRDKIICYDKCLSQQIVGLGKHTFVTTKNVFCHDKHVFVSTKLVSR